MSRVKIIGGGLTGILAALEAHRLGARDIELFERFDSLGGVALPDVKGGVELREGCIYFGPKGDPIREVLAGHGLAFEEFENRFGSVSLGRRGENDRLYTEDFGGPAVWCGDVRLSEPTGKSLADRLDCYAPPIGLALDRYCEWHLGAPLDDLHESAAIPLAINRVFPMGVDVGSVVAAKQASPIHDELFAIPRKLWGRAANATASLPAGGFPNFFRQVRKVLEGLGVTIQDQTLVSPRAALAEHQPGEVLVWAGNPTPLFKAAGVATPKLVPKTFWTYTFEARWSGPVPFYVQNFTATGACFRAYVYESGGKTLVTAECVREATDTELRAEVRGWLEGFCGQTMLGAQVAASIKPRWIYHSLDAIAGLGELRAALAQRMGPAFVHGAWEPYAKGEKLAQVNAALAAALDTEVQASGRLMRTAAIMQPTYLPYLGYFHLIAASDVFVFLDDVQFARRSWQQRNRIWGAAGEVMLTVPAVKTDRDTAVCDIAISDAEPWREKHLGSVRHTYAKRPFFAEGMAFLEAEFAKPVTKLADLNCGLVEAAAAKLGLEREFVRASTLGASGHRSDHLLAVCRAVGASDYLSPMGSHDYMEDDGVFAAAGFPARFQGFVEIAYPQGHAAFQPYMAFIDAVMNLGWAGTRQLIDAMVSGSSAPS